MEATTSGFHNKIPTFWSLVTAWLLFMATGCGHSSWSSYQELSPQGWESAHTVSFPLDSVSPHQADLSVALTHDTTFPYASLFLEISSAGFCDTVKMCLADPCGEWLGKGSGATRQVIHRVGRLTLGDTVKVRHIMRLDTLAGILRIGLFLKP